MTLDEARAFAKDINGNTTAFSYRNVWAFFPYDSKRDTGVLITKDSCGEPQRINLDNRKKGVITDYETGEKLEARTVFGKTFFDDDPSILQDPLAGEYPLRERIKMLRDEFEALTEELEYGGFFFMVEEDISTRRHRKKTVYHRLVALTNYIKKATEPIAINEIAYIHQELFFIR